MENTKTVEKEKINLERDVERGKEIVIKEIGVLRGRKEPEGQENHVD